MRIRVRQGILVLIAASLALDAAQAQEQIGTLALDGASFISYSESANAAIPPGSTIRFRFGAANGDGSVPITIDPADVTISPVTVPGQATVRYALAEPATGRIWRVGTARRIELVAKLVTTLESAESPAPITYQLHFSTGIEQATNAAATETVTVEGTPAAQTTTVRLVGAATNDPDAFPAPGEAVYAVLSGSFDWLPVLP